MKTIKIKKIPSKFPNKKGLRTGVQLPNQSLYTGDYPNQEGYRSETQPANPDSNDVKDLKIRESEPKVDRKDATIEAEKGEVIIGKDLGSLRKINGKPHSKGGTPLAPNPGDYIVSNSIEYTAPIAEALGLASSKTVPDGTT